MSSAIEYAQRINRTWLVQGTLAADAESYLTRLAKRNPKVLEEVCQLAVSAARKASAEQRDPKPDFYAWLFSRATGEERETFLKDHLWTRMRSAEFQRNLPCLD